MFHVQVEHVSTMVARKAIWLVLNQKTHVWAKKEKGSTTGTDSIVYYVLSQDNELGEKRLSQELIMKYECTLRGEKPSRLRSLEKLFGICSCMHKVKMVQRTTSGRCPRARGTRASSTASRARASRGSASAHTCSR